LPSPRRHDEAHDHLGGDAAAAEHTVPHAPLDRAAPRVVHRSRRAVPRSPHRPVECDHPARARRDRDDHDDETADNNDDDNCDDEHDGAEVDDHNDPTDHHVDHRQASGRTTADEPRNAADLVEHELDHDRDDAALIPFFAVAGVVQRQNISFPS
jgi:hypothetical protein